MSDSPPTTRTWLLVIGSLAIILILGIYLRLGNWQDWQESPEQTSVGGEVMLANVDGYYYLSVARDLVDDEYSSMDYSRAVPEGLPRTRPAPLLSQLAALFSEWLGLPLAIVAFFLPIVPGVLLSLPVFGLGYLLGGRIAGAGAALFSVCSTYYMARTSTGWFDTDCLLVTIATTSVFLAIASVTSASIDTKKPRWLMGLALVSCVLMVWAWDQAPGAALVLSISPLVLVFLLHYREVSRNSVFAIGGVVLLLLWLGVVKGWENIGNVFYAALVQLLYILKLGAESPGDYPAVAINVQEQAAFSFSQAINFSTGHPVVFFLALAGVLWMGLEKPRKTLVLAPLLVLAMLSFTVANRLLVFATPVLSLGIGYLAGRLWDYRKEHRVSGFAAPLLLLLLVVPSLLNSLTYRLYPQFDSRVAAGMEKLAVGTPADSVIWTHWDYGYPVNWYSERATIADGGLHAGQLTVYNMLPLASESPGLAANFMQFYSVRGTAGAQHFYDEMGLSDAEGHGLLLQVFDMGPEGAGQLVSMLRPGISEGETDGWIEFLFPAQERPLYLFLDEHLTRNVYRWYRMGTWNPATLSGRKVYYWVLHDINREAGKFTAEPAFIFNLDAGRLVFETTELPVKEYREMRGGNQAESKAWSGDGVVVEYYPEQDMLVFASEEVTRSVFHKLFIRQDQGTGYFTLEASGLPWYQVWSVRGDSFPAGQDR